MSKGLSAMTSEKGFTIVELAIVLVIVGILVSLGISMVGPLSKRVKSNETLGTIDAGIGSLAGYASTNRRLPAAVQFASVVQKANDAWGNPLYYIVDPNLAPASPAASTDYICGRKATGITVRQCLTDNCAATPGTDYNDISNVAFVIMSGGENFNVQTALAGTRVTVYVQNGATARDACTDAASCPSYSGTMISRPERYDDTVKWVTLEELRIKTGCTGQQLKVLNNELPAGSVSSTYGATVYGDGGIPYSSGGSYRWCLQGATGVLAADLPGFTVTPNVVSADCQGLAEGSWGQANNLQISKTAGPGVSNSYNVTIYVRDDADNSAANDNIAFKSFVITVNP